MKKNYSFYLLNTIIGISIFLILSNLGIVYYRAQNEKNDINRAKLEILEVFYTYAAQAFSKKESYTVKLDYLTKEIIIYKGGYKQIENIQLPKKLNYVTIFNENVQDKFSAKITNNGNITPSFTIYIFDYKNIAKYRISFYGFTLIKYIKINTYVNVGDKSPIFHNILKFHKNWESTSKFWKEE